LKDLTNLLVSQAPKAEVWRHFLAAFNIGTTLPGGNKSVKYKNYLYIYIGKRFEQVPYLTAHKTSYIKQDFIIASLSC
jgi:hypothetical protein